MKRALMIDGHVHVYQNFQYETLFAAALDHFSVLSSDGETESAKVMILLLTERSDCSFYSQALEINLQDYLFEKTAESGALLLRQSQTHEPLLYLYAGRQIISQEGLEICALASEYFVADRALTAEQLVVNINSAGGVAGMNWAPGKWFGSRGKIVSQLFERFTPSQLTISDTTMRPTFWPTPVRMAAAQQKGFKVICGSDPLPFAGEELMVAQYGTCILGEFDESMPVTSVRNVLTRPGTTWTVCGRRSGLASFVKRQSRIMLQKYL
ncbi:MAG: hypothetical protein EHM72_07320 [Calditrichaeota bacterium]|nr:MAG: hypothetical protein EHM72_07320 [Calditrichota bacterium]